MIRCTSERRPDPRSPDPIRRFGGTAARALLHALLLAWGVFAAGGDASLRAQEASINPESGWEAELQAGEDQLARGNLRKAEAAFDEVLIGSEEEVGEDAPSPAEVARAHLGLFEIKLRHGAYAVVADTVGSRVQAVDSPELRRRAERLEYLAAMALGRRARGEEIVSGWLQAKADDAEALFRRSELWLRVGDRGKAREILDALAQIDPETPDAKYWTARGLIARALLPPAPAEAGQDEPRELQSELERASRLLVEVLGSKDRQWTGPARVALGDLQFRVYGEAAGFPSGETQLQRALTENGDLEDALLTLYRLRRSNMQLDGAKTERLLQRVFETNPHSVAAKVERAEQAIDDRRFEAGADILDDALRTNPEHREALANSFAAAKLLSDDDSARSFRERALAIDPTDVTPDRVWAEHLVRLYRFADAVPVFEHVLAAAPNDVDALHGLAKALVYTGEGARARDVLLRTKAIERGFVSPWRNNLLAVEELLEQDYVTLRAEGFEVAVHKAEVAVLEAYLLPWLVDARRVLTKKYGVSPEAETVRVEVLSTWDDFSVRTIGYRGFTALGACFGRLITLVSPVDGDLRRNDFMWTATVWHEFTHVLTLERSNERVPRWLTEGFSVFEEGQRNPTWERGMDRELLSAHASEDLPPVRLMNRLFRGPQILFGYYLGGRAVEFVEQTWGFDKALGMLDAYGKDLGVEEVFEQTLGISTREFDARFKTYLEETTLNRLKIVPTFTERGLSRLLEKVAKNPDDLQRRVDLAWAWLQRDNPIDAGEQLRQIAKRDDGFGPALLVRAEVARRRGDAEAAEQLYEAGFKTGTEDFDSHLRFGDLLAKAGRTEDAIFHFGRAKRCWPECTEKESSPALRLARLHRDAGRLDLAMAELEQLCRRTARAFGPRLQLAQFHADAGNRLREAELLEEAIAIDPFMRSVHERLAAALEAIGRLKDAAKELEVALAVPVELDREFALGVEPPPTPAADAEARAVIALRLARLYRSLENMDAARDALRRVGEFAPNSDAAAEAAELAADWG